MAEHRHRFVLYGDPFGCLAEVKKRRFCELLGQVNRLVGGACVLKGARHFRVNDGDVVSDQVAQVFRFESSLHTSGVGLQTHAIDDVGATPSEHLRCREPPDKKPCKSSNDGGDKDDFFVHKEVSIEMVNVDIDIIDCGGLIQLCLD